MELIYTQFSFSQGFMLLVYVAFGLKPEIFFFLVKKISFSSSFRINKTGQWYVKWLIVLSL